MLSLSQIKLICSKYGIVPTKSRGQNFLVNQGIVNKIMAAADVKPGDVILEVGPGLGVLTSELIKKAGRLIAIELDRKACQFLRIEFAGRNNFQLVEQDALRFDRSKAGLENFGYRVVANLPYNITSKFLRIFLEQEPKPAEMILMVQKEVAQRIVAKPGQMSLLSLSAQFYSRPEILFMVSRGSFWPEPEVDSAVIKFTLRPEQSLSGKDNHKTISKISDKDLFIIARMGFSAKRKQLHNNLAAGLKISNSAAKGILSAAGFDEKIRAQDLSVEDWIRLAGQIQNTNFKS